MKNVANLLVIDNNRLLIVKKKDIWILPGGKFLDGESYECCLRRELKEELSTRVVIRDFYKSFKGITPYSREYVEAQAYFGEINGSINPSAEISDAKLIINFKNYDISDITKKIIQSLIQDGHLK